MRYDRSGIYRIRCEPTQKAYIGRASYITARLATHRWHLRRNKHDNKHLQNAWNKYGEEAFTFEVLYYCDKEVLTANEEACLSGVPEDLRFNLMGPVDAPNTGRRFTAEHRARISASLRIARGTPESRALTAKIMRAAWKRKREARLAASLSGASGESRTD
jgi:group I intron endonuclease